MNFTRDSSQRTFDETLIATKADNGSPHRFRSFGALPCQPAFPSQPSAPRNENALFLRYLNELRDRSDRTKACPPFTETPTTSHPRATDDDALDARGGARKNSANKHEN
jgi:hypothetical protein